MRQLVALIALALGCGPADGPDNGTTGALEIGVLSGGAFASWGDGDTAFIILGSNALNMIQPTLRATSIDPRGPDPDVTVKVAGMVMAADIEGAQADMQPDGGGGYLLRDIRVPFQANLCCYVCREGVVEASLRDASGRRFAGGVRVMLKRETCPDPTACCDRADRCLDPSLAVLCQ